VKSKILLIFDGAYYAASELIFGTYVKINEAIITKIRKLKKLKV